MVDLMWEALTRIVAVEIVAHVVFVVVVHHMHKLQLPGVLISKKIYGQYKISK